jgi:predicted O-linked N-acetylglucosamine transferase (SPINDLY family)
MSEPASLYSEAIRKVETKDLDIFGLVATADSLAKAGQAELAVELYKSWLSSNPDHPLRYAAMFNCGSQLIAQGDLVTGRGFLQQVVDSTPDFFPARLNLANVMVRMNEVDGSLAVLRTMTERMAAISRSNIDHKVLALKNIASIRRGTAEAEAALKEAIEIDPTQAELVLHWINNRQSRCIWPVLEPVGRLNIDDLRQMMAPLSAAVLVDDPELQRTAGRNYVARALRDVPIRTAGLWPSPATPKRERLRISYMSSDLCNHAIGYLMTDVFGCHDRSRFEIRVYNIGERTDDSLQQKIMANVDHWVDIKPMSDKAAAAMIVRDGVDILLDINGHTNHQRYGLLACKPAPIIINWLGYPGTMGSGFHDYIIADDFIIPEQYESFYDEKVLRLPCYQPNGRLHAVLPPTKSRTELGLPEGATIYCCFNGAVKITEQVFSRWMTILNQVPASVLWLRGSAGDTDERLRGQAARRGIAPERLVFLPFTTNTEYLSLHCYADVFLDTFPYGAHTTASDALRMGLPIVTLAGKGFPSRVCGSLSIAAGMPDLICDTPAAYVALAIELGRNAERRESIRQTMAAALPTCTLFDPSLLTRELEVILENVWAAHCRTGPTDS